MRHDVAREQAAYEWRLGARWNRLAARVTGPPSLPDADTEEAVVTEHYWGYTRRPDGSTLEYRVEHPRWRVWRATSAELDVDAAALYGDAFAPVLRRAPCSTFVADGSSVVVRRGVPLDAPERSFD
jgi:hypothetical protein